jgi:hopanoid-associated phosphorylase
VTLPEGDASRHRPVLVVAGMVLEADAVRGRDGIDVRVAMGPAARDLDGRLAHIASHAVGIVSFGTAGALDPALRPGDCVLASAVVDPSGTQWPTDARWRDALTLALQAHGTSGVSIHHTPIAGADTAVSTAAEKAAWLARTGAAAVDMESHALAALAAKWGLPFLVCRVILDRADHSLPTAALAGLTPDGRTVVLPVIASLLRQPAQLGSLLRLARDAGTAQSVLKRIAADMPAHFGLPTFPR